jgi:hypothetical protein
MTIAASLVALAMSGCTVIISTGIFTDVSTTHGVQIVAAVASHGTTLDTVTARLTNTGDRAVFVPRCGSQALLRAEELMNGTWTRTSEAACPAHDAASRIELDPGATVVAIHVFAATGRFRLVATVSHDEDFSDGSSVASNSFQVR